VAAEIGLDRRLLARGHVPEDLRRSANVLAALLEAVLAALYLELGLEEISRPVVEVFEPRIEEALTDDVDNKTALQEELAKRGQRVEYVTLGTDGPPHDRTFRCAAMVDGEQVGSGTGRTKKDAEQEAAREALERLARV
jgi:ribonuclease-3